MCHNQHSGLTLHFTSFTPSECTPFLQKTVNPFSPASFQIDISADNFLSSGYTIQKWIISDPSLNFCLTSSFQGPVWDICIDFHDTGVISSCLEFSNSFLIISNNYSLVLNSYCRSEAACVHLPPVLLHYITKCKTAPLFSNAPHGFLRTWETLYPLNAITSVTLYLTRITGNNCMQV